MSVGVYVVGSLAVHLLLITFWMIRNPVAVAPVKEQLRYVEFTTAPQMPRVIEGVGAPSDTPPRPGAPLSNANRTARAPQPSNAQRDRLAGAPVAPAPARPVAPAAAAAAAAPPAPPVNEPTPRSSELTYQLHKASAAPAIDWKTAIRTVSGAPQEAHAGGGGGEGGFAEAGPIAFESQWFDWGDYADHMVRRIKLHWHHNMPEIIKVGVKGIVTIRFTIERSGTISDVTILESSGVPPYDFAAKKAIELSSKLNPLPANFPGQRERVTARFFYNMEIRK